jgi:hypothetical protein
MSAAPSAAIARRRRAVMAFVYGLGIGIRSCSALSDVAERGRAEELDAAVLGG